MMPHLKLVQFLLSVSHCDKCVIALIAYHDTPITKWQAVLAVIMKEC